MNYLASLLLPATLGLVAGMAHGVVSHVMDMPMSLSEQVVEPFVDSTFVDSDSWGF